MLSNSFVSSIATILPMFLVLAYMYTVCQTIKGLVLEKEMRLKEVLRVVGVRNGPLWFAWFTENMVLLTIPCALISVMVKVPALVVQLAAPVHDLSVDFLSSADSEGCGSGEGGTSEGDHTDYGPEGQHLLAELAHQQLPPTQHQRTPPHTHPQGD
ncbi:hypothetical protein SRHO_G00253400 [Serrasalmus rhombeus]